MKINILPYLIIDIW